MFFFLIYLSKILVSSDLSQIIFNNFLDKNFIIGCSDKSLEIIEIQKEGRNKQPLKNFLMGADFKNGDELK